MASASAVPQFSHDDLVFVFFSNEHQTVLLVNHQEKCLINGICGTFDIKSNHFGLVIPKKAKKVWKNWIRGQKRVSTV